jgi:hypothetical protein
MNNNDSQIGMKLLSLAPPDEDEELPSESIPKQHIQENIIPPVGIAKPEILESFMGNLDDEEKIKRDVKDVEDYYKENAFDTAEREVKSYGLRALEGIGGTVGGLLNLLSGEANFDDKGELVKNEVPMLPSSHQLREFTKEKTGKRYEPKNEFGKNAHEAVTDIGSALPLPGGWFTKLLMPALGQSVKAGVKSQGGTESHGDLAKNSFMLMSTIANIGNAPQRARHAYQEATNMIPQGTRMSTRYMTQELNALRNTPWYRTGRTTAKGPAFDEIDRIENAIQHGSMDLHDAMQIRRDINQARNRLGAFNYEPGIDKAAARQYLDRVDDVLRTNVERWGQANNPEWLNAYRQANQAVAVTNRSMRLQDYIRSNAVTKHLESQTARTLFHLGGAAAISHAPAILGGAAVAGAAGKGIQLINRMIRSPVLRNHYAEVVAAASLQNAGAMNNALKKFDEEAKKLEESTKNFKKK